MARIPWLMAVALCLAGPAAAADRPAASPVQLAQRIEARAYGASFAGLQDFGREAARRGDREGLRRLHHVVTLFRSQSEFDLAGRFNDLLGQGAARQGDRRYTAVAALNGLAIRYDSGEPVTEALLKARARQSDWFARAFADTLWARVLIDEKRTGDALKLMAAAEKPIPEEDPDADGARAQIWEMIGLALMGLNDLDGAASAFERSQFEFADATYPRPDFDALYNLGRIAIQLGDRASAEALSRAHHVLTARSDLAHLPAWDANLCGLFAEAFQGPRDVMACLSRLDADLTKARFLSRSILPMRAIAQARLGQVAAARADLERLRSYAAETRAGPSALLRAPEVEAEILLAQGDAAAAYQKMRAFERARDFAREAQVYAGVRQVTGSLQSQLESARHESALTAQAVRAQRAVIVLGLILFLIAAVLVYGQRRGARRLRAAQRRAEAANAAKSAFLATMSHEIRTPLNGVLGMAQAMSADELNGEQRERLLIIRQSGEALLTILNDVLDLSKIEAGKLELESVPFDLGEVMRGAYSAFRAEAAKKGLAFHLTLEAAEGRYLGDPSRLRQILFNLISNAVKFTEAGEVAVAARCEGGRLVLEVRDTGLGIAPENLPKLFEKFDQLDSSTTRRFGGTGLGLAISQELAQLMGGKIWVESQVGEGSRFRVVVPLPRLGDAAPGAVEERPAATPPHHVRVLAAEDNAVNQLVLRTLLTQVGVAPQIVGDGAAAVAAWEAGDWDVILMDVQMPVMDGLAAARRIRELETSGGRRRTPILALTANAMAHQVQDYLAAGMDGHVAKPIEVATLLQAIEDVLAPDEDLAREADAA